jgi:tRNA(Ile)-lysidine synthase
VPFGDDESNFTDKYARNRIRRQLIETADEAQIAKWEQEINELNEKRRNILDYLQDNYDLQDVSLQQYRQENTEIRQLLLRKMISEYLSDSPSQDHIRDLDQTVMTARGNHKIALDKRYCLYLDYGRMYIADSQVSYSYQLEKGQKLKTPYFEISDEGQTIQRIGVWEDEWPLTIRSYQPSDAIQLRYGHKKVNRFFIDRKIPQRQRLVWPVVENCRGEIIFVHGIGCELHHFCTNEGIFMLK